MLNNTRKSSESKTSSKGLSSLDKELKELISDNESLKKGISKIFEAIDKPDSNSIQTN